MCAAIVLQEHQASRHVFSESLTRAICNQPAISSTKVLQSCREELLPQLKCSLVVYCQMKDRVKGRLTCWATELGRRPSSQLRPGGQCQKCHRLHSTTRWKQRRPTLVRR